MYVCECVWLFSFWSNFLFHIGLLRADITGFKSNWIPNINQYTTLGDSIAISMTKTQKPWGCGATLFSDRPVLDLGKCIANLGKLLYWKDAEFFAQGHILATYFWCSGLIPFRLTECSYLHHILRLPATKHAWYSGLECHGLGLKLTVVGKNMKQVETGALRTCLQCQWYDCLNKWKKQMATTTMF